MSSIGLSDDTYLEFDSKSEVPQTEEEEGYVVDDVVCEEMFLILILSLS